MTSGLNCSQMWRSTLFRSKQVYHLKKVTGMDRKRQRNMAALIPEITSFRNTRSFVVASCGEEQIALPRKFPLTSFTHF